MSSTYTTADKSLWDDSELIRLYEEQLKMDTERPFSKHLEVKTSLLKDDEVNEKAGFSDACSSSSSSSSPSSEGEDGRERVSSSVSSGKEGKDSHKTPVSCSAQADHTSIVNLLMNTTGSGVLPSGSPPAVWGELAPVLQAFYHAGFAAGSFCTAVRKKEKEEKRKRCRSEN